MLETILNAIRKLGKTGCQGNPKDYQIWLEVYENLKAGEEEVENILTGLTDSGEFVRDEEINTEFRIAEAVRFPDKVEYTVSGSIESSTLQLVRSRIEAFLKHHKSSPEKIIDINIATVEALENAIKYSDHNDILVTYELRDMTFHIQIINHLGKNSVEQDIKEGKYDGSTTLMRGMMVMIKLFDEVDISISEDKGTATLTAVRKIK